MSAVDLSELFGIAEVIACTTGHEEDLEWAAKFREARAAAAELLESLSDFEGMTEPSMPGTPAKIRRLRGAYARCIGEGA